MSYKSDYAFYQKQLAETQQASDETNDWLGFPRTDLAHAKAIDRQLNKNRPTWQQLKDRYGLDLACAKYEQAISGK